MSMALNAHKEVSFGYYFYYWWIINVWAQGLRANDMCKEQL